MREALAIGIPTFVVLLGILWNGSEIRQLRSEVSGRLDRIEANLRQFYHELGRHEGEY